MKLRLVAICGLLFATSSVVPAAATTVDPSTIIDYCGNSQTGVVQPLTSGMCLPNEYSLGNAPISRGDSRPRALIPQFNRRDRVAKAAARKAGYSLRITSGYRSYAKQNYLWNREVQKFNGNKKLASRWVLPPSKSNHPWGIAIDVNYGNGSRSGAKWLEKNGYKFGLCRRYKNEWWHFEPLVAPGTHCPAMEKYAS